MKFVDEKYRFSKHKNIFYFLNRNFSPASSVNAHREGDKE